MSDESEQGGTSIASHIKPAGEEIILHCSFCGLSHLEVTLLIAGGKDAASGPNICDACVLACVDIIMTEKPGYLRLSAEPRQDGPPAPPKKRRRKR